MDSDLISESNSRNFYEKEDAILMRYRQEDSRTAHTCQSLN